jgi:hypothetical protein
MRAGAAGKERRGRAKRVAARPLDVDDLRAELAELGADIRLGDEDAGADDANAFERAEFGDQRRRGRPLEALRSALRL